MLDTPQWCRRNFGGYFHGGVILTGEGLLHEALMLRDSVGSLLVGLVSLGSRAEIIYILVDTLIQNFIALKWAAVIYIVHLKIEKYCKFKILKFKLQHLLYFIWRELIAYNI